MKKKQYSLEEKKTILTFYGKSGETQTVAEFGVSRRSIFYWKNLLKTGGEANLASKSRKPKHCGRQKVTEDIRRLIRTYYIEHITAPYAQIRRYLLKQGQECLSLPTIGKIVKVIKEENSGKIE